MSVNDFIGYGFGCFIFAAAFGVAGFAVVAIIGSACDISAQHGWIKRRDR
jgi:hypothetical protein